LESSGGVFRTALRAALPAIVVAVLVLTPFLRNAYTIDDTLFLDQASHLLVDPLHPTAFDGIWSFEPERMSHIMASGPGMAYLLVPCVVLGGAEWVAHTAQLALFVLAILATAALAVRMGIGETAARAAALLLATTPAALGMAATAMPDVPAMALGVFGVERALAFTQERRVHQAIAAALSLSAAALFRSHLVLLVGIAALGGVGHVFDRAAWSRWRWSSWIPLAACPVLVATALVATRDLQASSTVLASAAQRSFVLDTIPSNLIAYFAHWTFALPLALPLVLLEPRRIFTGPTVYLGMVAAWLTLGASMDSRSLLVAAAVGLGVAAVWDVMRDAIRNRDGVGLMLGLWLLTPLVIVPYLHLPSKYLLAAAPAAAMSAAMRLARASRLTGLAVLGVTLILGLTLGVSILRAEALFAELGRKAAAELVGAHRAAGANVWFDAHWGFQWYAEKAGGKAISTAPPFPVPGDLMVTSAMTGLGFIDAIPQRRLIATVTDLRPGGRVMSRSAGAGFFTNGFGYLPWAWAHEPADRYDLWQLD